MFDFTTGELLREKQIFRRNKVHGIKVNPDTGSIVIYGGKSLAVVKLDDLYDDTIPEEYSVGDWIIFATIMDDILLCLTAHNDVVSIDLDGRTLESKQNCNEKSIIYSGCIGKYNGRIIVCSGTVMDGVLVWDLKSKQVLHRFTEHEGSIFFVEMHQRYILSCSDDRSIRVYDLEQAKLQAVGWGHRSRIWSLNFYDFTATGFKVLSTSEDCTTQAWQYTEGNEALASVQSFTGHTGRNVWSGCVDDIAKLGFSGGSDGKLMVHDLAPETRPGYLRSEVTLKGVKAYFDYGYGLLAVSGGKFYALKEYRGWEFLFEDSKYAKVPVVSGSKEKHLVVVGGSSSGAVLFLKMDAGGLVVKEVFESGLSRVKSLSVSWPYVCIESPNLKEQMVLRNTAGTVSHLPRHKADISSILYLPKNEWIVIGCAYDLFLVYNIKTGECVSYDHMLKGNTITCLATLSEQSDSADVGVTTKDGVYGTIRVSGGHVEVVENNRLPTGFLQGMLYSNGDRYLYGFKSDEFYIWNETKQYSVVAIACDGSHGLWDLVHWTESQFRYRLSVSRGDTITVLQNGLENPSCLLEGVHGREVRALAFMGDYVVSGSEDTYVKLSYLSEGRLQTISTQRQHRSGLQAIHPVNDDYVLSSSSREELYLWKISHLGMRLVQTVKPLSDQPDLRVMDFDTIEVVRNDSIVGFLVAAVYSDSEIRLWYYNYSATSFKLVSAIKYTTCCILHTRLVQMSDLYLSIATTDGHFTLYKLQKGCVVLEDNLPKLEQPLWSYAIHQSSIKAVAFTALSTNEYLLVTGGDDNALTVSHFTPSSLTTVISNSAAAASAIISAAIVNGKIITISVDQKVRLWTFDLELIEDKYTTVADPGCLAVSGDAGDALLIGGAGISTWKLI